MGETNMVYKLPPLPYEMDALEPHISKETLAFHYGKHHQTYVDNLNKLIPGSEFEGSSLEDLIKNANGGIFNNAAQIWNHTFYWHSLSPNGGGNPPNDVAAELTTHFGSVETFKEAFSQSAITLFGSGWAWLVKNSDGSLAIIQGSNADNPLRNNQQPLLTCDVWEHAYYIDVRNARPKYVENFWQLINWDFVAENMA